jgi:hypothetical protein
LNNETITATALYKASYTPTLRQYAITFVDWNGSELKAATSYDYGTAAVDIVKPANPTKSDSSDGHFRYAFAGWTPELAEVT